MTKLLSCDTFKIAIIGSFLTVSVLAICGTVITVNESSSPQLQSTSVSK